MDAEVLIIFLDEAEGYLPTMRRGIMAYESDPSLIADLQTSRRQAHTIKGAALMLDLTEIGELARELESELKIFIQTQNALSEEKASEFLSRILILESLLKDLRQKTDAGNCFSEKSAGAGELLELSVPMENLPPEPAAEEFDLDPELIEVFSLEAEDLLRSINENLEALAKSPEDRGALLEIRRSAHTLKGSAGIVGFKKLSALAHRVEDLLDYLSENRLAAFKPVFDLLQASTDCLSALASGENTPQLHDRIERLYRTFDEIFASLRAETPPILGDPEKSGVAGVEGHIGASEKKILTAPPDKNSVSRAERRTVESEETPAAETARPNPAAIRVSVERINDLFNLVGEMVISRSIFEQRLRELEQQIEEQHHTTRRLKVSTAKLETDVHSGALELQSPVFDRSAKLTGVSSMFESSPGSFDALEFDRYDDLHQTRLELIEAASDSSAVSSGLDHSLDNLNLLFDSQRRLIEEMQLNLLRLRMVSFGSLAPRLQRAVRVTAEEEAKQAELVIENVQLEIETEIIDSFVEPLLHLIRNAVAHGIEAPAERRRAGKPEKGKIILRAFCEGTYIVFVVKDDGGGISVPALKERAVKSGFMSKKEAAAMTDQEAYSLIFLPGLSTAVEINQVSGRGVGMNVVNACISRRHGTISVKSETGKGTSFTIRMPMSLTTTRAILVRAGQQIFAFPLNLVRQITEISVGEFSGAAENRIFDHDGVGYSVVGFNELVNLPQSPLAADGKNPLILLKTLENPCALLVDQILKTEEIVIKPLDPVLRGVPEITGATIIGDGSVIPVLDLIYLLKKTGEKSGRSQNASDLSQPQVAPPSDVSPPQTLRVLVVDDSPSVRQMNSRLIKTAGWEVFSAKDGLDALETLQVMSEPPDVILSDVEMPRMDGYELLASLKGEERWQKLPVVMITSRASEKHRRKAFDLGASAYLIKPYEDAELLNRIRVLTGDTEGS